MMGLDEFLTKIQRRPLPKPPMERVRALARELAEGAAEALWGVTLQHEPCAVEQLKSPHFASDALNRYLERRWRNQSPPWSLLKMMGFVEIYEGEVEISASAFALLDGAPPASAFISYRRKDSSAFALLTLDRLRAVGVNAYVDMALRPGSLWRERIREEIQTRETLVLLVGIETLTSDMVRQEIVWALDADVNILPIWHNGFVYEPGKPPLPTKIDYVLTHMHTIRVLEESALAYHTALTELAAYFGQAQY